MKREGAEVKVPWANEELKLNYFRINWLIIEESLIKS